MHSEPDRQRRFAAAEPRGREPRRPSAARRRRIRRILTCAVIGATVVSICMALGLTPGAPTPLRDAADGVLAPGIWAAIFPPALLGASMLEHTDWMLGLGAALDFVLYSSVFYFVWSGLAIKDAEREVPEAVRAATDRAADEGRHR